MSNSLF